jgi:hypothetical protein
MNKNPGSLSNIASHDEGIGTSSRCVAAASLYPCVYLALHTGVFSGCVGPSSVTAPTGGVSLSSTIPCIDRSAGFEHVDVFVSQLQ